MEIYSWKLNTYIEENCLPVSSSPPLLLSSSDFMWQSKTKNDLIIEVWERLDCESVGAQEIEAIEIAVQDKFGFGAVDSPMIVARLLADEGAELRDSEILELDVKRRLESPYDAMFRNLLKFSDFKQTLISIRRLENLRKKFTAENDREGLRLVRETALKGKNRALMISKNEKVEEKKRAEKSEIAEWFTLWMQSPEIFESWVLLRQNSQGFKEKFEVE